MELMISVGRAVCLCEIIFGIAFIIWGYKIYDFGLKTNHEEKISYGTTVMLIGLAVGTLGPVLMTFFQIF